MDKNQERESLAAKAKNSTESPGVYLMKDLAGVVIYVGKAKNLKNRLQQYFTKAIHELARTELMVRNVHDFDLILTQTETEALILEATLIKKHKPKFNVRLKDDKAYPYIKINITETFPRLLWTRRILKDSCRYFGPFPSAYGARQVLELLTQRYKLRDCSDNTFRLRSRPCLLFEMDQCTAPCVKEEGKNSYNKQLTQALDQLSGASKQLVDELTKQMEDLSENLEFEKAAVARDQIQNIEMVTSLQSMDEADAHLNRDVVCVGLYEQNLEADPLIMTATAWAHGVVLQIRAGKVQSVKHFNFYHPYSKSKNDVLLHEFMVQYYTENPPPDGLESGFSVLVSEWPVDQEILCDALKLKLEIPQSESQLRLMSVCKANVQYSLKQSPQSGFSHGLKALQEIQSKLGLDTLPVRIECYDISNTSGEEAVASRVVFVNGGPDKSLYRKYKIKTVEGSNDFAMMKEVLKRRLSNQQEDLPDLIVVDGGKGQLAQAVAILGEIGLSKLAVVGLAKARTESDFTNKEVISSDERIFIPGRKNPIALYPTSASFKLLTHIRNEAHRFAIEFHRKLRHKKSLGSG